MSTGLLALGRGGQLPYHRHGFSEAVTILEGEAQFEVEGRRYLLTLFDCIHVPSGFPHAAANAMPDWNLVAVWAFASPTPARELVADQFMLEERSYGDTRPADPEHLVRFHQASKYELAEGTEFVDLFGGRFGTVGICGGYGKFKPGTSLPCHIYDYDESITIVEGEAICEVMGRRYRLNGYDTAFVPAGRPHRFLNESRGAMAMVWVYAGSEPARTIVDTGYCTGCLHCEKTN
jgi:HTH-type transcriptional repressor of puuD